MRRLALLAALTLLLASCGPFAPAAPTPTAPPVPSVPGPTAVPALSQPFALPYDPQGTWDPYGGGTSGNLTLLGLIAQGLYELDRDFSPQPVLAEGGEADPDGLSWTFTLRAGVTWSDGAPFTAADAAACLNAARRTPSIYAARLREVTGVAAREDGTLKVELAAPHHDLPALLDVPLVRLTEDGLPLGTGPYALEGAALTARDGWREDLPADVIPLTAAADNESLIAAFDAGTIALTAVDMTRAQAPGFGGSRQTWTYPTSTVLFLGCQGAGGPCADPRFRRAVSLALDRQTMLEDCLDGWAQAAAIPALPGWTGCPEGQSAALERDPEEAARLLDELGYAAGEDGIRRDRGAPVTLKLVVNADSARKVELAQAAARDLEALGLTVTLEALGWEQYLTALSRGRFDLYLGECRLTADMDLAPFLTPDSGLHYGVQPSEALTAALEEARRTGGRTALYDLWVRECPVVTLGFKTGAVLTRWGRAAGLCPTQGNLFYGIERWTVR